MSDSVSTTHLVKVKGVRDGLVITLADGPWAEVRAALLALIRERQDFFRGARVALDVGNRAIRAADLGKLRDELADYEITLWAVVSGSPKTQANAQALGLATRLSKPLPRERLPRARTPSVGEPALFVPRTLRSGMRVEYEGHVIVLGDVNPGAEIVATGHVIVWGRLKGTVHAGAQGNAEAVVCALDLTPTQLRIAEVIATAPPRRGKPRPEIARLKDGQVVAEPWDA